MLDTLPPQTKLLLVAGVAYLFFRDKSGKDDVPFPLLTADSPPGAGAGLGPAAPQFGTDGGAAPRRYEGGIPGARTWESASDTIQVKRPPFWGVVGCCRAWATAGPSVRGASSGGGAMESPRSTTARRCGCRAPTGQAGSRSWFLPIEQAARQSLQPDVEVTPEQAARYRLTGEGAGSLVEVPGFVHDGVAWVVTSRTRNWWPIADENPDVLYLVSTAGRCAYHVPTGRVLTPGAWRPRYKGQTVAPNPDPWAVDPWHAWMLGQQGGRRSAPLQADGNRVLVDFVAPPYMAAFLAKPAVVLPFTPKSPATTMKKPAKVAGRPKG